MVVEENRVFILNIRNKTKKNISDNVTKTYQHLKNLLYLLIEEIGYEILNLNLINKSFVNSYKKELSIRELEKINKIKASKYYSEIKKIKNNLSSVIFQQAIKQVLNEYKSYFMAKKKGIKNVRKPRAKKLNKINNSSISFQVNNFKIDLKNKRLILTLNKNLKLKFSLPKWLLKKKITSIRLVKKLDEYELHIVYKEKINLSKKDNNKYLGIDLGLDNLMTLFSNDINFESLIISGKEFKSFNQWFNKLLAKLKLLRDKANNESDKRKYNRQIRKLYRYRNRRLKSQFHQITSYIIELANKHNISTIVISDNILSSKNGVNLGKKNNQNFVSIPFKILLEQLKYKAKKYGIKVLIVDESYTSKCNCLTDDIVNVNNDNKKFSGKRVKRGLYHDFIHNIKFNADINGAVNIIKKVKNDILNAFFKSEKLFKVLKRKLCRPKRITVFQLQNVALRCQLAARGSNYCNSLNHRIYQNFNNF